MKSIFKQLAVFGLLMSCSGLSFAQVHSNNVDVLQQSVAQANEDNFIFSYCDDKIQSGMGLNKDADLSCAIYLPSDMLAVYKDNALKGVYIGLYDKAAQLSLFVSESLDGPRLMEQSVGDLEIGWHYIAFDKEVPITGNGLYVGYRATGYKHIGISNKDDANGAWLYNESWKDYSDDLEGSICLKVEIGGDVMPQEEMSMESLFDTYAQLDEKVVVSGVVRNNTTSPVSSYVINYSINDGQAQEVTFDKQLMCNDTDTFRIELDNTFEVGTFDVRAKIASVNGKQDANGLDNGGVAKFYNKEYLFQKKVVLEEGTATWCAWCPMGIVAVREMKAKYPETFIPIAVHVTDEMQIQTYQGLVDTYFTTGLPNSVMDRKEVIYPSFDDLESAYLRMAIPADAGVELNAEFADEASNKILIKTKTTFGFSEEDANYRLIFALVENGVMGYPQSNNYAGGANGPMGGFENYPNPVPGDVMVFDDVARGVYKSYTGILQSIPKSIVKGEGYDYEYTISIPFTVADKDNLEVVAMIYDLDNTQILNADIVKISPYSGIEEQAVDEILLYVDGGKICSMSECDSLEVYNINGMQVNNSALERGVYVVKIVCDGKTLTEKVFVD